MKKHFILLGKTGLIYYCWLFVILFVGLIIAYETTESISWIACSIIALFLILFCYSLFRSYYTVDQLVLPYRFKIKDKINVTVRWSWKFLRISEIKLDPLHHYWLFYIEKKEG